MRQHRLRLDVGAVGDLPRVVASKFGPYAEIVAAERVTVGGLRRLSGREHFEVTVAVPEAPLSGAHSFSPSGRTGIDALLDHADEAEARIRAREAADADSPVSTSSVAFDALLGSLLTRRAVPSNPVKPGPPAEQSSDDAVGEAPLRGSPQPSRRGVAPPILDRAGDLVVAAGLDEEPLRLARRLAALTGASLAAGGELRANGMTRIDDRRSALAVRSIGVRVGASVIAAVGLGGGRTGLHTAVRLLASAAPDQVWIVVDARRKPEDTIAWVDVVRAVVPIAGVSVIGAEDTTTPESIDALGLPILRGRHAVT